MSRVKILNIVFLSATLVGCGILDPYVDRRRNPGTSNPAKLYSGQSTTDKPAICYNPFLTKEAELQAMADAECVKNKTGTHAEFIEKDGFSCKVLLPATAFYKCVK